MIILDLEHKLDKGEAWVDMRNTEMVESSGSDYQCI